MTSTGTPFDPLAELGIHHDSIVRRDGGGAGTSIVVLLDEQPVMSFLEPVEAERFTAAIERRIKHAQLVHGIRQMADFIEQRPQLELHLAVASVSFHDREAHRPLAVIADQLGEYEATVDAKWGDVIVERKFGASVAIRATGYKAAVDNDPQPVVGRFSLPKLPGRNLAAEPETQAA